MELTLCPRCDMLVSPSQDGTCPGCQGRIVSGSIEPQDPLEPASAKLATSSASTGMTMGEQLYSAAVILCSGFFLLALASFHFMILPQAKAPEVIYFVLSIIWTVFLTLSVTSIINLRYRSLVVIPTVLQCVILCVFFYFSPIGIWGAVLLYRRQKREHGHKPAMTGS